MGGYRRAILIGGLAIAIAGVMPAAAFARTVLDTEVDAQACAEYPAEEVRAARERAEAALRQAHAEARGRIDAQLEVETRAWARAQLLGAQTAIDAQLRQSLEVSAAIEAGTREAWGRTIGRLGHFGLEASACAGAEVRAKVATEVNAMYEALVQHYGTSMRMTADAVLRLVASANVTWEAQAAFPTATPAPSATAYPSPTVRIPPISASLTTSAGATIGDEIRIRAALRLRALD